MVYKIFRYMMYYRWEKKCSILYLYIFHSFILLSSNSSIHRYYSFSKSLISIVSSSLSHHDLLGYHFFVTTSLVFRKLFYLSNGSFFFLYDHTVLIFSLYIGNSIFFDSKFICFMHVLAYFSMVFMYSSVISSHVSIYLNVSVPFIAMSSYISNKSCISTFFPKFPDHETKIRV